MRWMLTSTDKARELGVAVSSVKRWAAEGKLEFTTTPGGHRRFRSESAGGNGSSRDLDVVLALSDRLYEIGEEWVCGRITVAEEHRLSHQYAETLDHMRTPNEIGPLCILACPPGELHDLPLRMVRLVLEWRGWRTDFLGASTPWDSLRDAVAATKPDLIALSARDAIRIPRPLGAPIVVGGSWVHGPRRKAAFSASGRFGRLIGGWRCGVRLLSRCTVVRMRA